VGPYNLPWGFWKITNTACSHNHVSGFLRFIYYSSLKGPRSAKIHIISDCNYDCTYCYSDKNRQELSFNKIRQIIDQLSLLQLKTLELTGGEPFLSKNLENILSYARSKGLRTTIFSNGSLIDKSWAGKLGDTVISVKYDRSKNYQAKNKTSVTPEEIDKNIRHLVRGNVPVVAFITVSKDILQNLKDIIRSAISTGAFPAMERYIPVKDDKINRQMAITARDWEYALSLMDEVYRPYKDLIETVSLLQGGPCSCYTTQFSIMQDGSVLPCQFLPLSESIGNVNTEPIKQIWKRFEQKRKKWKKLSGKCSSCNMSNKCAGGCNTHTFYNSGSYNSTDPLCTGRIMTYGQSPFIVIHSMKNADNSRLVRL